MSGSNVQVRVWLLARRDGGWRFLALVGCSLMLAFAMWGFAARGQVQAQSASPAALLQASEPPTELVDGNVASYDVPSPGLFWHSATFCPLIINSASAGESGVDAVLDAAGATPAAADQLPTPFSVRRMTVRGEESRFLMHRDPPTPCARYPILSNIVADSQYVYFVNNTGLVRLPVTANYWDEPTLLTAEISNGTRPVELLMDEGRILAAVNRPSTDGPFGQLGASWITAVDTSTGAVDDVYFNFGFDAGYRALAVDEDYVYALDFQSNLVRFDAAAQSLEIAENVRAYTAAGKEVFCLQIQCTTSQYVIYSTGNTLRRFDNVSGENILLQTRQAPIRAVLSAPEGFVSVLIGNSLFWFEEVFVSSGGFGGTYTHSLYRAGNFPNATPELLYFYSTTDAIDAPVQLRSDGRFLFWLEGGGANHRVMRLPNNVGELPKVDLAITGMEITQGVQNNANSVRLIRNRATYVRVFVRATGQNVPGVTARLYGTVNDVELGPLVPIRGTHLTVKTNPSVNQLDDSFLFALPWEWSAQDDVTLRAVLNPFRVPQENSYSDNVLGGQTFAFSEGRALDIIFVEANYRVQRTLDDFSDYSVNDTNASTSWLRRAFPLPEDGLNYRVWTINGGALLGNHIMQTAATCVAMPAADRSQCAANWVRAKMGEMRARAGSSVNAATLMYGLIPDSSSTGGAYPRGNALGNIAAGPTGTSITTGGTANYGYYTGHEVGHMLGRGHPFPNSDDPATTEDAMGNPIIEGCGHSRADFDFPHFLARIGPGNTSVRGYDRGRRIILNDADSFDIMSYCGDKQLQWVSDYTWEGLYQGMLNLPAVAGAETAASLTGDWLGVFGTIHEDGDSGNIVVVHNVARMDEVTAQSPGDAGAWQLVLLDGDGLEVATYLFGEADDHEGDGSLPFDVVVPFLAGTQQIQIRPAGGGAVSYEQTFSPNAPVVTEVALADAPEPVNGVVTLIWQATDADGDDLLFDIYYSVDSGESYVPLAFAVIATAGAAQSVEVDTSELAGGMGHFRVIASDGVNQGAANSPDYTLAVKAPQVNILAPADGDHFNWGQVVNFSGEALDAQDGLLVGGNFIWSNQNNVLGTGPLLSVDDLPVGLNVITLSTSNSAGIEGSAQISIMVGDPLELPGPLLQVAPSGLSFQFDAGATQSQTRIISLDNAGGGTMDWAAQGDGGTLPGEIEVTVDPAGAEANTFYTTVITVTGIPTGVDAGEPEQVQVVTVGVSVGNTFDYSENTVPDAGTRIFLPQLRRD